MKAHQITIMIRLTQFQLENLSAILTVVVIILLYLFSTVAVIKRVLIVRAEQLSYGILITSVIEDIAIFIVLLIILKFSVQIVWPYNDEYDVFNFNKILKELFKEITKICDITTDNSNLIVNNSGKNYIMKKLTIIQLEITFS